MNAKKSLKVIGTALVLAFAIGLVAHAATITDGMVGRWMFNEASGITASDSTSFADSGTLSGAALLGFVDPQLGNVLSITGVSGSVSIPYQAQLNPAAGTISVWVNPTLSTTSDIVFTTTDQLIRCNEGGRWYAYDLRINKGGSVEGILANDNPKTCVKQPQTIATSPNNKVIVNTWTHLVMRWDGVGTMTVFANGRKVASSAYVPNPTQGLSYSGNNPVLVGSSISGSLEYSGELSDLRIYGRALSDTEIQQIYQGQ